MNVENSFYRRIVLTQEYPELTPYQFASNRPVDGIGLDGEEFLSIIREQQARQYTFVVLQNQRAKEIQLPERQILMPDIYGVGNIGKESIVRRSVEARRQEYYLQIGDNIRGGPGGAIGYLIGGDRGSFVGAAGDQVAFSFSGIPGRSNVLSTPKRPGNQEFIPSTTGATTPQKVDNNKSINFSTPPKPLQNPFELYPGVAREQAKYSIQQLSRSIRSTERTIAEHQVWLANPLLKQGMTQEIWNGMTPQGRTGLINKWQNDKDRNKAYLQISKELLKLKSQ